MPNLQMHSSLDPVKPLKHTCGGGGEGHESPEQSHTAQMPSSTLVPSPPPEALENLSLLEHFRRCQHKYSRPSSVGNDMLSSWRMVGHNEETLRDLCRKVFHLIKF